MLNTAKSISISGTSIIDGKPAASMSATIPAGGNVSINTYIQDRELYDANKTEIQTDIAEFNALVYETEV
ncbi:MAG: hypothetical protein K2N01_12690 [Lachnospiraceae bacterium]|nr:hypothetical protein [Lachnospiraceae bacterium]